jgi:hypothetical protein
MITMTTIEPIMPIDKQTTGPIAHAAAYGNNIGQRNRHYSQAPLRRIARSGISTCELPATHPFFFAFVSSIFKLPTVLSKPKKKRKEK